MTYNLYCTVSDFNFIFCQTFVDVPFNNMENLKFKSQPRIVFKTAVNSVGSRGHVCVLCLVDFSPLCFPRTFGCQCSYDQ